MLFIQTYYRLHSQKLMNAFAIDNRVKIFVYESRGSQLIEFANWGNYEVTLGSYEDTRELYTARLGKRFRTANIIQTLPNLSSNVPRMPKKY